MPLRTVPSAVPRLPSVVGSARRPHRGAPARPRRPRGEPAPGAEPAAGEAVKDKPRGAKPDTRHEPKAPAKDKPAPAPARAPAAAAQAHSRHWFVLASFVALVILPTALTAWYAWTRAAPRT